MLIDSDEVLEMFCFDCAYRDEPLDYPVCSACTVRQRIESVHEQHQQWSRDSPEDRS